jgi:ribosomal protein S18 acetylase RimI-like enzyme
MYSVNQLNCSDFLQIETIFRETFPRTDDADFNSAWRTKECNSSLGLYYKAKLVGFAITTLMPSTDAQAIRLWFIAVDSAYRSSGAGTQLLTAVMKAVSDMGYSLTLTPDNCERVIKWYLKHGFAVTKTMPFIHRDIPTCWMEWGASDLDRAKSRTSTETLESMNERNSFCSTDSGSSIALEI